MGAISAEEIYEMGVGVTQSPWPDVAKTTTIAKFSQALRVLNQEIAVSDDGAGIDTDRMEEMQAQTYTQLFDGKRKRASTTISQSHRNVFSHIYQIILAYRLNNDIAQLMDVDPRTLLARKKRSRAEMLTVFLDYVGSMMILANAVTLTLCLDVEPLWGGWQVIEAFLIGFFILEITLRIGIVGWREYFFGPERSWNCFDLSVIILGLLEIILDAARIFSMATQFTIIRVLRLLRCVKMVRVLRIKMLK